MTLHIKNEETHRLARQLARDRRKVTVAVREAIRERLERVRESSKRDELERLVEIGRECSKYVKEPYKSIDHGTLLYDEKGLPK